LENALIKASCSAVGTVRHGQCFIKHKIVFAEIQNLISLEMMIMHILQQLFITDIVNVN